MANNGEDKARSARPSTTEEGAMPPLIAEKFAERLHKEKEPGLF